MSFKASGLIYSALFTFFLHGGSPTAPMGITVQDQGDHAHLIAMKDSVQLLLFVNAAARRMEMDVSEGRRNLHFSADFPAVSPSWHFTGTYIDARGQRRQTIFSSHDLAGSHFLPIEQLNVDPDLAEAAFKVLLDAPCQTPNLQGSTAVGLSLLEPSLRRDRRTFGGIFYASEYWGCVLGGGGWQECGDIARAKWGSN